MLWVMDFLPQLLSMLEGAFAEHKHNSQPHSFHDDDYEDVFTNDTNAETNAQIREAIEMIGNYTFAGESTFE